MYFVLVHHILTAFSFFVNIMLLYPQIRLILPPMRDSLKSTNKICRLGGGENRHIMENIFSERTIEEKIKTTLNAYAPPPILCKNSWYVANVDIFVQKDIQFNLRLIVFFV